MICKLVLRKLNDGLPPKVNLSIIEVRNGPEADFSRSFEVPRHKLIYPARLSETICALTSSGQCRFTSRPDFLVGCNRGHHTAVDMHMFITRRVLLLFEMPAAV